MAELPFPVPPKEVQDKIILETRRRQLEAQRLRAEAERGWQEAKAWFETQLLGEAAP